MISLANDLLTKSKVPAKGYKPSHTGRPPKYTDENGNPESSHSIADRYGCSYGKIMWLFKKYGSMPLVYDSLNGLI